MQSYKILLDGPIGSGKTTFLTKMISALKSSDIKTFDSSQCYFKTDAFNYLQEAYNSPSEWAFNVQMMFFSIFRNLYHVNTHRIQFYSRSIDSIQHVFNKTYMTLDKISDEEYMFLNRTYKQLEEHYTKFDVLIFFKCDLNTLVSRAKAKDNCNSSLDLKVLTTQYNFYEQLLKHYLESNKFKKCFIIDTRSDNNKELYKVSQYIEDENKTYNSFNSDEEVIEYIKKLLNQEK